MLPSDCQHCSSIVRNRVLILYPLLSSQKGGTVDLVGEPRQTVDVKSNKFASQNCEVDEGVQVGVGLGAHSSKRPRIGSHTGFLTAQAGHAQYCLTLPSFQHCPQKTNCPQVQHATHALSSRGQWLQLLILASFGVGSKLTGGGVDKAVLLSAGFSKLGFQAPSGSTNDRTEQTSSSWSISTTGGYGLISERMDQSSP